VRILAVQQTAHKQQSVSGAIFLILEMYMPYAGSIQLSSAPLRAALAYLGQ
jgi:hypothetical protein